MTRIYGWDAGMDGCTHYRIAMPLAELRNRGHDTVHHSTWNNEYPARGSGWFKPDVLVGQRVALDRPTTVFLSRTDIKRRVYEFDDDFFNVPESNPAHQLYGQPGIRANIARCIEAADAVTCTTDELGEVAREHGARKVFVIPNTIPAWLLDVAPPVHETDRVVVGWAGSGTHSMDWSYCGDDIRKAIGRVRSKVHVKTIGTSTTRIPVDESTPWQTDVPTYYRSIDFDIGLAPLRPHAFNSAKSPVKALEYAGLGVPIIASDVGPYSRFVRHGETGYLVRRPHEWGKYLRELVECPELRWSMGAAARRHAANYTIERWAMCWEAALCGQ